MKKTIAALRAVFVPRSAAELAKLELEEAERALLKAQTAREYSDAIVTFEQRRITRLRGLLATHTTAANESAAIPLHRAA